MTQTNQLSKREKEVLGLLLQGKSNKDIALSLGISDRTVEFHLSNIYTKLHVSSRIEAVLKLKESTGSASVEQPEKSTVDRMGENTKNGGKSVSQMNWAAFFRNAISMIGKESEMKQHWKFYFPVGIMFGAGYWHYLSITAMFFNRTSNSSENTMSEGWLLILALLTYFGVWLIPAVGPAVYEFHRSTSLRFSVLAVILVWISAVVGYYVNYVVMLAFVGLPHMEYLVVFGQRTATFWQDWSVVFPKLILYKFMKWAIASVIVGGFSGLVTSSVYSTWVQKSNKIMAT